MYNNFFVAAIARQFYLWFGGYQKDEEKISIFKGPITLHGIPMPQMQQLKTNIPNDVEGTLIGLATAPRNPEDQTAENYRIWWQKK